MLQLEPALAVHSAEAHAAARDEVQCGPAVAFAEMANFEVVERALSNSARPDEGRARHGSVSKSEAAAFKPASVSAPAYASTASSQTECASMRT